MRDEWGDEVAAIVEDHLILQYYFSFMYSSLQIIPFPLNTLVFLKTNKNAESFIQFSIY